MGVPLKGECGIHLMTVTGKMAGFRLGFADTRWLVQERECGDDPCWSTVGLYTLRDGDRLTIYRKDDPSVVVWSGLMKVKLTTTLEEMSRTGRIDFAPPEGVEADDWQKWFTDRYPAELVRAPLKGECAITLHVTDEGDACLFPSLFDESYLEEAKRSKAAGVPHRSKVGLHRLKAGDRLTVYDKENPSVVVWSGVLVGDQGILFESSRRFPPPPGVDAETWIMWLNAHYPADLEPAP